MPLPEDTPAGAVGGSEVRLSKADMVELVRQLKETMKEMVVAQLPGNVETMVKASVENVVSEQLEQHKHSQDITNAGFKTDVAELRKLTKSLPKDGNMTEFVKLQVSRASALENLNTSRGCFEDTMDMSYGETLSESFLVEGATKGTKTKSQAPGEMKNSWSTFVGPSGSTNWLNCREEHFSTYEVSLIGELPMIIDRYTYFEGLRASASGGTSHQNENPINFDAKWMIERQLKWNDNFVAFTPDWDTRMSFEDYFSGVFWRSAKDALIDNPDIFKSLLFRKVMKARPDMLGILGVPEKHSTASALKYYLYLRRMVSPYADGETASKMFYDIKQTDGQTLDKYFNKKLVAFRNMHPSTTNGRHWRDFYDNFSKGLQHDGLAADMSRYGGEMRNPDNFSEFLNCLIKRGAHYVSWGSRTGDSDKVNSCHTTASLELFDKDKGEPEKVAVHQVSNIPNPQSPDPSRFVQVAQKSAVTDSALLEFIESGEPILESQMQNIVAALNKNMSNLSCWWCDKPGHVATECYIKKQGKPPLPHSRFGKKDKNKTFDQKPANTPTNRVASDQFKRTVNQVEFDRHMEEKKQQEIDYLINAGMEANLRHAPI